MPLRSFVAVLVLLSALASTAVAAPVAQQPPAGKPGDPPAKAGEPGKPADKEENRVVTSEAIHAVVLPMKGSYDQHQAALERLAGYLAGRGVTPAGSPFARYFSDPSVGEAALQWEVGFPVASGVKVEPPFEVRDLPAVLTAVHVHRGSYEELSSAWPAFVQWILANGYQPAGPPLQLFKGDFSTPNVEMRMPVQK